MSSILFAAIIVMASTGLRAEDTGKATKEDPATDDQDHRVVAFPDADFYPPYVADPLRAQSALIVAWVSDTDIPATGSSRFVLRLGGRFPLVRIHPDGDPSRGLQLDFEGGFYGHFDIGYGLDNIGWDGLFGLLLNWKPRADLGFRIGTLHDSAHVGDEYAERTGRKRIGYTRQELVAGASWAASQNWRYYTEAGYAIGPKEFQERLRLQLGGEVTGRRGFWDGRGRWYAALDLGAYDETDWDPRLTSQLGIIVRTGRGSHRYRFAIEYGNGRSALGEFMQRGESTLGLGWYFDF